jgi:hypothetical protein
MVGNTVTTKLADDYVKSFSKRGQRGNSKRAFNLLAPLAERRLA